MLVTVFLLGVSNTGVAQERGEIPPLEHFGGEVDATLSDFIVQYERAWRSLDAEYFANLHSEDTEWTNAFARIFRTRNNLAAFLKNRLFPQFKTLLKSQSSITLQTISTRSVSESAAVAHLYTDLDFANSETPRRVHFHLVLERQNDQWKIVHTAIMDPRL